MYTNDDKALINHKRPLAVPRTLHEEEDPELSFFMSKMIQKRSFFILEKIQTKSFLQV